MHKSRGLSGLFASVDNASDAADEDYNGPSRKQTKDLSEKPNLTKPVNFISTGTVMPNHFPNMGMGFVDLKEENLSSLQGLEEKKSLANFFSKKSKQLTTAPPFRDQKHDPEGEAMMVFARVDFPI